MNNASVLESDDYYERLGLERAASTEEIKRAYRTLLRQYPPERSPEQFKRIREAYETLENSGSRAEYDQRPDPVVAKWLHSGNAAMQAEDYTVAERYFKQVLLQAPDLNYVRNLLGLSFLYQGEAAKAVVQFERLVRLPMAPAAWFGNAGHAYSNAKRYSDAERAFKEAARRATDNPVNYVVGLADVFIEQANFAKAVTVLEEGIKADGVVDFQDLGYFTKLLEVRVLQHDLSRITDVLQRMRPIASDDLQRRHLAFNLGVMARNLVAAEGFRFAKPIAHAARALQPHDSDYIALDEITKCLGVNDFVSARHLLETHESFAAGGWLVHLGLTVRQYVEQNRALGQMKPLLSAPSLRTINGIGTKLYGERDRDANTGSYVATLYFVVLFIPVFPLACYRVISCGASSWSFLGAVPFSDREKRHWIVIGIVTFFLLVRAAAPTDGRDVTSTTLPSAQEPVTSQPNPSTSPEEQSAIPLPSQPPARAEDIGNDDEAWFATERTRMESLESDVRLLNDRITPARERLQSLKRDMQAVEGGYGSFSVNDPAYDRLVRVYNECVDDFNALVQEQQAVHRRYKAALAIFNARVDSHNARLRR